MKILTFLLVASTLWAAPSELQPGTLVNARLLTSVSTATSKAGDSINVVVIAGPLAGTALRGRIDQVKSVQEDTRATLKFEFSGARVVGVDNARESVDTSGRIQGILESETLSSQLDLGLERLERDFKDLAAVLRATKLALIKAPDAEISYPAGTELTLELTRPAPADGNGASHPQPTAELIKQVETLPLRTVARRPALPSDLTNLLFIGTREAVEQAFRSAGWSPARKLDANSAIETAIAIIEARGYHEAPVSTILLEGRYPEMVFQKTTNTFAKRHHVRIWRVDGTFGGNPLWIGAATHDTGIAFAADERAFYHTIDAEIDKERDKIVNDLVFDARAERLGLVERAHAPRATRNATGDRVVTDGRIAVVRVSYR